MKKREKAATREEEEARRPRDDDEDQRLEAAKAVVLPAVDGGKKVSALGRALLACAPSSSRTRASDQDPLCHRLA